MPKDKLERTLFPLGGLRPKQVRDKASSRPAVFDKPDSQEICFIPDNDYAGLVATPTGLGQARAHRRQRDRQRHRRAHRAAPVHRRSTPGRWRCARLSHLCRRERPAIQRCHRRTEGRPAHAVTGSWRGELACRTADAGSTRRVLAVYRGHGDAVPATLRHHPELIGPTRRPHRRSGSFDDPQRGRIGAGGFCTAPISDRVSAAAGSPGRIGRLNPR